MSEDVLIEYAREIALAERYVQVGLEVRQEQAIAALAAEVRGDRDRLAKLDLQLADMQTRLVYSEHGFKLALGDSVEYHRQAEELRARLAELESHITATDPMRGDPRIPYGYCRSSLCLHHSG